MINEKIKIKGVYEFKNMDTGEVKRFENIVVQNFFDNIFKAVKGETSFLEAVDFATGDGTTAAIKTDTALENELFRKNLTLITSTDTKVIMKTNLAPSESNFQIKECGIFATDGSMISRANVDIEKNASTQYLVSYTITII